MPRISFTDIDGVVREPARYGYNPTVEEVLVRYNVVNPAKVGVTLTDREGNVTSLTQDQISSYTIDEDCEVTITKLRHASGSIR